MKARTLWSAGIALAILLFVVVGWWLRTTTVVWGFFDPDLQPLAPTLGPGTPVLASGAILAPWDQPDLVLTWSGPWGTSPQRPLVQALSGNPPSDLTAYQVFGLISPAGQAEFPDFARWTADLDRKTPGTVPLALAGKTDAEFLNAVLWFADGVLGPERLASSFEALSTDPLFGVGASGALPDGHPWAAVVKELRQWAALGRLAPNWWDYADTDVEAAVAQGTARWGLTWSDVHFAAAGRGVSATVMRLPPAWPNRRSFSLVGRWVSMEDGPGWGGAAPKAAARERLKAPEVGQDWLRLRGLLLANTGLASVNQESKALSLGLLSAGAFVAGPPPSADLARWKPLLEALRAAVK